MPTGSGSSIAIASSSVGGADDSDERSESEGAMLYVVVVDVEDKVGSRAQQASRRGPQR